MMQLLIKKISDLKIRKKVILTLVLICIIPIVVLGSYCYYQIQTILVKQEKENLQKSLHQASTTINSKLQVYNNLSNYIAYNQNIIAAANTTYTSYFEMYSAYKYIFDAAFNMLRSFHQDILKITIYTNSNLSKHGDVILPLSDIQDTSWGKKSLSTYNIQWFTDGEDKIFSTRQLFWEAAMSIKNLLYIEVDFHSLFSPLENISAKNYGIYITDETGNVIYSQHTFEPQYKDMRVSLDEIINQSSPDYKGKKTVTISKETIDACKWNIYLYKPIPLIVKSANQIALTVLTVIGICLCILLPLSRLSSYMLVTRIEKLTENIHNMESKNLEVTVTSTSKDEIGELIRSFTTMIGKINTLIKEVYESKIAQKEFEMKALQAQINPHFLYNSLSLINWKAIAIGEEEISRMTQLLSTFYRTTLNKGKNLISVEDELKNTTAYIEIQLIMHSSSFDVIYDIDDQIRKYSMINLLLQPLVENAINHGIDHKINGRGCLKISGHIINNQLIFSVEDNGAGITPDVLSNLLEIQSTGYGLKNVNDRIKLFYGTSYGLTVESVLNEKTIITMTIPVSN